MWVIGALLFISFALFLYSRIAKTQMMSSVFLLLGMALSGVAMFLTSKNESAPLAIMGFLFISGAVSDLIARPILRRRLIRPRIHVKRLGQSGNHNIAGTLLLFFLPMVIVIYLPAAGIVRSFGLIALIACASVYIISYLILGLFGRVEICGNGVWDYDGLQRWEDYESFSWKSKTRDIVELRHVSSTWLGKPRLIRMMVAPEDRDTVQQLLQAHLPDLIPVHD